MVGRACSGERERQGEVIGSIINVLATGRTYSSIRTNSRFPLQPIYFRQSTKHSVPMIMVRGHLAGDVVPRPLVASDERNLFSMQ